MYSTPLILTIAFAAFDLGQADKGVDPAVAAARARQKAAKTVVLEFKQTEIEQPGNRSAGLIALQRDELAKIVPENETVSESKNRVVFDGVKMRFENNHPMWSLVDGKLRPSPRVEVDDGEMGKSLFPLGFPREDRPRGRVHGSAQRLELKLALLNTIYFAFRGADPERCPYPMPAFKPTGASLPIGDHRCDEYALRRTETEVTAWLDPDADYVVRRLTLLRKGKLLEQHDAQHRRDEKWGWVPTAWTMTEYSMTGDLLRTTRVEVTALRIGEPQPASEFQIKFPPGTFITDLTSNKYYWVEPNESMTEVTPGGQPVPTGSVATPQPRGDVPLPSDSFVSRHKWLLTGAALGSIAIVLFFFIRRRHGIASPR
jgi:outer membrane lipoprotein-sorting protein